MSTVTHATLRAVFVAYEEPDESDLAPCRCVGAFNDPQAHAMAALIAGGRGVVEAARLVFGPGPDRGDARSLVRVGYALAFPWLRLPEELAS